MTSHAQAPALPESAAHVPTAELTAELNPVSLQLELGGRLRNIGKPKNWFIAVAEAIKNSIDAIEEASEQSTRRGSIEVFLEREKDLASLGSSSPVRHVTVRDNGVGFTDPNFQSFCKPDSLYKLKRGGKGVGRLVCIQTFKQMRVSSAFHEGGIWKRRHFVFQQVSPELSQALHTNGATECVTEVRLTELNDHYSSCASVELDHLADWLTEHFLPALLEAPKGLHSLTVHDGRKKKELTQLASGGAVWSQDFKIGTYDFTAKCYPLKSLQKPDMVRLVAGGRVVDANTRSLEHYLPHLEKIQESITHVVLVSSSFFDEHINDARNGVSFSEDGEEGALLGITANEFRHGLATAISKPLHQRLLTSIEEFQRRVEEVVQQDAPYYRPLLTGFFSAKDFSGLTKSARSEEILTSLDAYRRRSSIGLKKESKRLAKITAQNADYWESARKLANQVEMQKKVALAEYISLRRIVLQQLEDLLNARKDGKASFEEEIHNLVFPQKVDSETSPCLEHQLWIVDERLEAYNYLASDKPLDGLKGDRPDLLIALDRPSAFARTTDSKARGYERVVLVEFKRALKDLAIVPTDDLPHRQMMRYVQQIEAEKAVHVGSKRPVKVGPNARFYLYAICELSSALMKRLVRDEQFTPSPTGDGAFQVLKTGSYYLEYISLSKLLEDAQARNRAFFERLGLEG